MDGNQFGRINTVDYSEKPRNIAVHSRKRLLFWIDVGSQHAIFRARIDGSEHEILAHKLDAPTAIAVDQQNDLVFFAYSKQIDVMNLDGGNR